MIALKVKLCACSTLSRQRRRCARSARGARLAAIVLLDSE
jgi:hypothetical protein